MATGATLIHGQQGFNIQSFPDLTAANAAMLAEQNVKAAIHCLDAVEKLRGETQAQAYAMLAQALDKVNPNLAHLARQHSLETFPTCNTAIAAFNAYVSAKDVSSGLPFIELACRFGTGSAEALTVLPKVYKALGMQPFEARKKVYFAFGSAPYWPGFDPMYVVARLTPENNGIDKGFEVCPTVENADIVVIFQNYPYPPPFPDANKCVLFQLEPPEIENPPHIIPGALYNGSFDAVNPPWTLKPMHDLLNQTHNAAQRSKRLVIIVSNKTFTAGHRARLQLAEHIAAALGEAVDVFGVGLDASKFSGRYQGIAGDHGSRCRYDVLSQYQYVLACENSRHNNYFTEKVMDPWLAGAVPIYWGAPNLHDFVPADSFVALPERLEDSLSAVIAAVAHPPTDAQIKAVNVAKHAVLTRYQMWPELNRVLGISASLKNTQGIRQFIHLPDGDSSALCISLKQETERRKAVAMQCSQLGIKVEFIIVERHADPVRGCLESHMLAVSIAKQRKYPWVLILEDDVVFTTDWLDRQLYLPPHWEMCMLGHNIQSGYLDSQHLIRALGAYTTHAYIMRNTLYDFVLQHASKHYNEWPNAAAKLPAEVAGIDVFYRHNVHSRGRTWAIYPMLATQAPGYSSIEKAHVDYSNVMAEHAKRAASQTAMQFWNGVKCALTAKPCRWFCHYYDNGNRVYTESGATRIAKEATLQFDHVISYRKADLPETFQKLPHFAYTRGAGYWVWKPMVILMTLQRMEWNDELMYADTGCTIVGCLDPLFNHLQRQDVVPISVHGNHLESTWTKRDLFKALNAEPLHSSVQRLAGVIIVRKTAAVIQLVQDWLNIATNLHFIDDSVSVNENYPDFREHRHDMSIWSLLTKLRGYADIPDPTYPCETSTTIAATRRTD